MSLDYISPEVTWGKPDTRDTQQEYLRLERAEQERRQLQAEQERLEVQRERVAQVDANETFLRSLSSIKDEDRTRLAQLRRKESEMESELDATRQRLAEYP